MTRGGSPRLAAYVLAADPAYLAASLASYLDLVDVVVLSHDAAGLGWGGRPVDVGRCLAEAAAVDRAGKVRVVTGDYCDPQRPLLESDTRQRQEALDAAGADADWVLQVDADEVLPDPEAFHRQLLRAEAAGVDALDFPSRWLWARLGPYRYLEACSRWGGPAMSYPGPLAVRAGTRLRLARQADVPLWRADVRRRSTDPYGPARPVHAVVGEHSAVLHFSWVRPEADLREKAQTSGHARDFDWDAALAQRDRAVRHPHLYRLGNPVRPERPWHGRWVRPARLSQDPSRLVAGVHA